MLHAEVFTRWHSKLDHDIYINMDLEFALLSNTYLLFRLQDICNSQVHLGVLYFWVLGFFFFSVWYFLFRFHQKTKLKTVLKR